MINVVLDNNSKYVTFKVYGMSGKEIQNIRYIGINGMGAYNKGLFPTFEDVFWTDKHPLYVSFRVHKNSFLNMLENMDEDCLIEFYNSTTQEILLKDTLKITYENEIDTDNAHEPIDDITSEKLTKKSEKTEYKFYNEYC